MNSKLPTTFPLLKGFATTDDHSDPADQVNEPEKVNTLLQDDDSSIEVAVEPTVIEFDDLTQVYNVINATEGAIPGIDFEVHGDHIVEPIDPTLQQVAEDPAAANDSLKILRLKEFKNQIEVELQPIINQATEIHKLISTAKTSTKRSFYSKKFKKLSEQVRQYVSSIQQIEALINSSEGEEHVTTTIVPE
jgi:hypothetical protein